MKYDIVLCVGPQHSKIAVITIQHICNNFNFQNLWIVANKNILKSLAYTIQENQNIYPIEEEEVIQHISLNNIRTFLQNQNSDTARSGWYFQQFLKMNMCHHCLSEHYLIWDADTIPLKNIQFFEKNKSLIQTSSEYHLPYFSLMKALLNLEKIQTKSFITEHMMVSTSVMDELIKSIQQKNQSQHWVFNILALIDQKDLALSGFSEYETYGTYALKYSPSNLKIREENLKSFRYATRLFTLNPSVEDLEILRALNYDYVTFEVWDEQNQKVTSKNKKLALVYYKLSKLKLIPLANIILKSFEKKIKKIAEKH